MPGFPLRISIAALRLVALGTALGVVLLVSTPAVAQFGGNNAANQTGLGSASQRMLKQNPGAKPEPARPAALPGSRVSPEAAPATRPASDMSPTDALFDAINRGDATAARDAVNRGANMDARSLIGLTPLELSVDLARSDISFLLLSMRGEDSSLRRRNGDRRDPVANQAARVPPVQARTAAALEPRRSEPVRSTVATPRLYSGQGGAPIPNAGFLGFDGGRAVQ